MQSLIADSKKQTRLYGQLLVDFANAPTTGEACRGLLHNIGDICETFCIRSRSGSPLLSSFPSLNGLKSYLSKPEKALMMSLFVENRIKCFISEQFEILNSKFEDYNSHKQTLTFREITYPEEWVNGKLERGEIQYSKPFERHIGEIRDEEWTKMKPWTKTEVEKLFKIGRTVNTSKKSVPESKFSEIRQLSKDYSVFLSGRQHIETIQKKLKSILLDYVRQWDPSWSFSARDGGNSFLSSAYFLAQYNRRFTVSNTLEMKHLSRANSDNNSVEYVKVDFGVEVPSCHAPFYSKVVLPFSRKFPYPKWYDAYEGAVVFCLIEYLRTENRELIRRCHRCQKLYHALKAYTSKSGKYFCRDCGGDNRTREQNKLRQRERRAHKKEEKERQRKKARVENLMTQLGCTKKEAEDIIKVDSEIDKAL